MPKFVYTVIGLAIGFAAIAFLLSSKSSVPLDADYKMHCEGPPLTSAYELNEAQERGYQINPKFNCVDKKSFQKTAEERSRWEEAQRKLKASAATPPARKNFADTRAKFQTRIRYKGTPIQLPMPAHDFVTVNYLNKDGRALPAYLTPDPKTGEKRPAIIWLTGGDTNSLSDVWSPQPSSHDESASAFRESGIVMLFPTLRGGNADPAMKELFYGEVDDVTAAFNFLASQPYVDKNQIYLGGHSTGGTLALLVAESRTKFRAVFSFGPIDDIRNYGDRLYSGFDFRSMSAKESEMRSPENWLRDIEIPVYIFEGEKPPANVSALRALCSSGNQNIYCYASPGDSHFSILFPVNHQIATQIKNQTAPSDFHFSGLEKR